MRTILIALTILVGTSLVFGQAKEQITPQNFNEMVRRGLKVMESGPYRYTRTESHQTVTTEVDAKRSIRTTSIDNRTGETGECMIIGERIYHRSNLTPWTGQTMEEYRKAQVVLGAAMRDAKARKDHEAFKSARAATANNLAIFTALYKPSGRAVLTPSGSKPSDLTVTFVGNRPYRDTAAFYSLRVFTDEFPPPSEVRDLQTDGLYAFDAESGALLKAELRFEWSYKSEKKTSSTVEEWERDTSIVVAPPVAASTK